MGTYIGSEDAPLIGRRNNANTSSLGGSMMGGGLRAALCIFFGFFLLVTLLDLFFVVPPGMVGVVVTLGHIESFQSGLHTRVPWISHLVLLTTKTQLLEEKNAVPTKEGLSVSLDTAVLFRLDWSKAADLYREVGADYINVLIKPEAASAVRGLTSDSEAKALYSSGRNMIQDTIKEELTEKLAPRGVIIQDVLLKDIHLPQQLTEAIEMKLRAEQESEQMEFVLRKAQQEATRKAIEAGGIADFQRIVSEGISPMLLKWKGVEATEKFANSPNTKLVLVGNTANGMPVILNADD
jgi:prohibitin 1